jgi:hypothetical protein
VTVLVSSLFAPGQIKSKQSHGGEKRSLRCPFNGQQRVRPHIAFGIGYGLTFAIHLLAAKTCSLARLETLGKQFEGGAIVEPVSFDQRIPQFTLRLFEVSRGGAEDCLSACEISASNLIFQHFPGRRGSCSKNFFSVFRADFANDSATACPASESSNAAAVPPAPAPMTATRMISLVGRNVAARRRPDGPRSSPNSD